MVSFTTANKNFVVKIVADNLLKPYMIKSFLLQHGIVDKLLLEKISIAAISRVTDISEPWLQSILIKKINIRQKKWHYKKRSIDLAM